MQSTKNTLFLCVALAVTTGCTTPPVEIWAIANGGFLVRSGGRAVLVDALFRATAPYPEFFSQGPSEELVSRMIDGEGAFSDIDLALVTHSDGDHFDAETTLAFVERHPETLLVGTGDVVRRLAAEEGFAVIADRVVAPVRNIGSCETFEHRAIRVSACSVWHSGGREVANNIYIVDLDGFVFLHEGDADRSRETFAGLELGDAALDLAFLHDWFVLNDGREVLTGILNPRAVVLMHHRWERAAETRSRVEQLPEEIAATLPPVAVLGSELESVIFDR